MEGLYLLGSPPAQLCRLSTTTQKIDPNFIQIKEAKVFSLPFNRGIKNIHILVAIKLNYISRPRMSGFIDKLRPLSITVALAAAAAVTTTTITTTTTSTNYDDDDDKNNNNNSNKT
jgi:hypothetical protein